jgi:DNA-binding SARP family transcriptional activator/WD40 repeat protein
MSAISTSTAQTLWIGVLGPLRVALGGRDAELGGPKQRAVLAILVAARGRVLSRDQVIEGVWGEVGSDANRKSFHTYVSNLRAVLGGEAIVRSGEAYRLDVGPGTVDSQAFEAAVSDGRRLVATDPGLAAISLREALGLWRGRPYADLTDIPGIEAEVRRLEELRLEAVELRVDAELASGLHGSLIAEVAALAEEHPMRERFRAQQMLALYRSGRQSEALKAYRRTESFLAEELGVDPSDELRDLELKILQHDESLLGGSGRAVTQRLAILATDIEGSTVLWDRNPAGMAEALTVHDRVVRDVMAGGGAKVFRHSGHGVLAAFPSAVAAVAGAGDALAALEAEDWGGVGVLRIRVGVDVGEVEARGGEFFGPPVNRAVRLCAAGHGGQVLISEAVQAEVVASGQRGIQFRQLGEHRLRDAVAPERIAQLVLPGLPDEFPELRVGAGPAMGDRGEWVSLPGYEVRERLGEGAFGVVWRAYQPSVGREVAVKLIRSDLASRPSFVRRFEAEARTIARLGHPHVVPLIDFWRDHDSAYLVMALMEGGSLAGVTAAGALDIEDARRIVGQVGSALDYAHSRGVVHGDLRPENVLLDGTGNAYLADFMVGADLAYPETSSAVSATYRAPELDRSGPSPESDRFAFAVLVGELLSGVPDLESVLSRGTASEPGDRYLSASALLADVDHALGEPPESAPVVVSRNPFKGLRAFEAADAADFHGRDVLVGSLLDAVSEHRLVAVVGPSGSGKSSVVQAGLLPALANGRLQGSEGWVPVVLTPGASPLDALAEALESVSVGPVDSEQLTSNGIRGAVEGELLLVVDQFEELYTLASDDQRRGFLGVVLDAVEGSDERIRVVVTLRADFYDRPLEDRRLGRLVRDGLVTVLPPMGEELQEIITAPARAVGLRFEEGLVYRITEDVAHQPGGLPLLQYALTELVDRRSSDVLAAADYQRIGGVGAALARRAESMFAGLSPRQQAACRQVLLRMVTVDEDTDDTRRRVRRTELESLGHSRADLDTVLDSFIGQRLFITDRDPATRSPTVEIAHEALIREWPRLTGWIDDQREALILGRRFRTSMVDWETSGENEDYLLTGSRLAPYIGWAETSALTPDEHHYYQASQTKDHAERTSRRRRRGTLTGILAASAVIGLTLGGIAAVQAGRATREAESARQAEVRAEVEAESARQARLRAEAEADRAELNASIARSRELLASAEASLATDPSLAKLLAVASTRFHEPITAYTTSILHRSFAADRTLGTYSWPLTELHGADIHPGGSLIVATGVYPARLEVFDMDRDELLWEWESEGGTRIEDAFFTPDGEYVLAGIFADGDDPTGDIGIHMWDTHTGELVRLFDFGECGRDVVAVSVGWAVTAHPSGECDGDTATIGMLDLESGEWTELVPHALHWTASGDGRFIAYSDAQTSSVVEVATGEVVLHFARTGHRGLEDGFVQLLNYDGSFLVAGHRPIAVWDVATGELVAQFQGHPGEARAWAFSEDGETVYSSGRENTVRVWSAADGQELDSFPAVGSGRVAVAGDRILVSDWATDRVRLLDATSRREVWAVDTCDGWVLARGLTRVGDQIAVAQLCGEGEASTFLIDAVTRDVRDWAGFYGQHQSISPDGTRLVRQEQVASPEVTADGVTLTVGPLTIRDLTTGDVVARMEGLCVFKSGIDFFVDGEDQCEEYPATPFAMLPWETTWTLDSNYIVNVRPGVTVWDAATGELVSIMDAGTLETCPPTGMLTALDGHRLLFGCQKDDLVLELSTDTWEYSVIEVDGWRLGTLIGYTPDEEHLISIRNFSGSGAASLEWLATGTFEVVAASEEITQGSAKSYALSPNGRLLAIGTSEGFVHVWDIVDRRPVERIFVAPTQMQGVVFLSDTHLAVAPQTGGVLVYTLDPDELVTIVRGSLIRGFTPAECDRYGFGDECPTLAELRGEPGTP